MEVNSVNPVDWATEPATRTPDHMVQDVFSEVLSAAGREGYASAEPVSDEEPLTDQISAAWSDWFDGERRSGRYQGEPDAEELKQAYGEILLAAYQERGHTDPHTFLQNLSREELAVVQQVHRLADPIRVNDLSVEGAVNLLVPPDAQVDLNHDGLTRSGAAYRMRFPDSNTPPGVVAAWEEATAGMNWSELAVYEIQMLLPLLTANIVVDDEARFVRRYEPGDPEFTNPMASSDYSYVDAAQNQLDYLEAFRLRMPQEQYDRDKAFWTKLHGLLETAPDADGDRDNTAS